MPGRKKIALCLEYPLALRGGVSVLVETLLLGLSHHYDLILVSPDRADDVADQPISKHLAWDPKRVSPRTSRALAHELAQSGVALAHFHLGGNYGWGNRFPNHCPIPYASKLGVAACSTVHLVVNPLDGFCGPQKPLWFKLTILPLAWAGKMQQLAGVQREIAVSQHDAEKLRRWYRPLRGKFVQIYHSRLQMKSLEEPPVAREPLIMNVGHIAWRKGQLFLAEAFAQVAPKFPQWKLMLAGGVIEKLNEEKIRAVAKAHRLEDRILLPGERKDAMDLMKRAAVYVQPSYYEALGLALQEALFLGCPAIGTRVGGIPELVEHERTGLLVEPGNIGQMARALETLMSNPELRADYGRQGAATIIKKGMTADQMINRHVELYESIFKN